MVPLNLRPDGRTADYIVTGTWSEKAAARRALRQHPHRGGLERQKPLLYSPDPLDIAGPGLRAFYEQQHDLRNAVENRAGGRSAPLVCDASSDFLHKSIDMDRYGLIYAGAQKNLGPAGLTLVIIRKDLLERATENLPIMLDYNTYAKHQSLYNTPPVLPSTS